MKLTAARSSLQGTVPLFQIACSCCVAFGLNIASMVLITKTSSLTLTVAGVVKDILLLVLSALLFGTFPSSSSLIAYSVAFVGLCFYTFLKVNEGKSAEVSNPVSMVL